MNEPRDSARKLTFRVLIGALVGAGLEVPALFLAVLSAGAGHGDYVAARALFPLPMLSTVVEGEIGMFSGGLALLQFPIYGALIGWIVWRRSHVAGFLLAAAHMAAAAACFSGAIPNFS